MLCHRSQKPEDPEISEFFDVLMARDF